MTRIAPNLAPPSPLEQFVRDYVEVRGGDWDEVEPQVYDLMLGEQIVRVAFDPEALPEHPQAQLASFGSPLIDRLLADAAGRGARATAYVAGLNLHPHDLPGRVGRALSLPADTSAEVRGVRAMEFPQAVFWFEATFASDQNEQEIVPVAIDLHYLRQVRHLDPLLSPDRLSESPAAVLPEAPHEGLASAYGPARERVVRTVAALANARRRELLARVDRQAARMRRYYDQLRAEAEEQAARATSRADDGKEHGKEAAAARLRERLEGIDREAALRIAELRQKSALRVRIKLLNLLAVRQPKLLVRCDLVAKGRRAEGPDLVWDPLTESVEAVPCPGCGQPGFAFGIDRLGRVRCTACMGSAGKW